VGLSGEGTLITGPELRREFSKFSSSVQEALITSTQRMIHATGDYSRGRPQGGRPQHIRNSAQATESLVNWERLRCRKEGGSMSITSAQGYEMRIAEWVTRLVIRRSRIGKPLNGSWQIGALIISPDFSLTHYGISIRRKAKRE
jgi:hypothetical protein